MVASEMCGKVQVAKQAGPKRLSPSAWCRLAAEPVLEPCVIECKARLSLRRRRLARSPAVRNAEAMRRWVLMRDPTRLQRIETGADAAMRWPSSGALEVCVCECV